MFNLRKEQKFMSKRKTIVKITSILLVVITCFSIMCISASAATWRTGKVPNSGNSGYTTVWLSNTSKNAKIKIHSYTYLINPNNASEKSTSFHVTMRTYSGRWLWEGDITTGSNGKTLNLGCNNSVYKICIRQNSIPFGSWSLNYANYWGIQCVSNCHI